MPLGRRALLQVANAALLVRRHRRMLWGLATGEDAAYMLGEDPGYSPSPSPFSPSPSPFSPSPSPLPPAPPGPPPYDPEDLPHYLVIPFILLAFFLTCMAGMMSGLTLGLMSLDQVDLEILRRSGTDRQKQLAQRIMPLLARPHVLLCTLLVCNALAAEALPLVLDRLADPATAIVVSVTVVLLFGEIIPQAACSRFGLQIGAYSAPFVRFLMFLTAPISYPIGWMLDIVLGHRHTALFRRAELKALVDIHREGQEFGGQLSADEVAIIKGALDMTHKTARHAMTPIDLVFMLPADAVLDEATLTAIMASGHSRIPVHRPGDRSAVLGIMLVKELLMVDKDAGVPVGRQKVRSLPAVNAQTPLYDMLKLFEIGRSHMALLMQLKKEAAERRKREGEERLMAEAGDLSDDPSDEGAAWADDPEAEDEESMSPRPTACLEDFVFDPADFEPVGIITIEDVLEELLQAEILDETDQFVDNLRLMPINVSYLMNRLPPHLRPLLASRSLLPRIGGASFMMATNEGHLPSAASGNGLKAYLGPAAAAAAANGPAAAAAAAAGAGVSATTSPTAAAAAAAAAVAGADARASVVKVGGAGKGGAPLPKPPLAPLSPRTAAAAAGAASRLGSARGHSAAGSGSTTPPGGGSVHAGILYRQGTVGAALVAEALRQEIAQQIAAAAAAGGGHRSLGSRGRTRSLSPLPDRGARHASRGRFTSSDDVPLLGPAAPAAPGAARAPSPPPLSMAGTEATLFPGLRRAGSGDASGASTPRLVVPLPPLPPRRSTSLSARAQQQMDLLQPLLEGGRRAPTDGAAQ